MSLEQRGMCSSNAVLIVNCCQLAQHHFTVSPSSSSVKGLILVRPSRVRSCGGNESFADVGSKTSSVPAFDLN